MISAYNEIITFEGDDWEDYFTKVCLIDIFKDFINLFKDRSVLRQAIKYVAWAYSKDSDCVILRLDWLQNKRKIFDKALLHDVYYEDLVLLKNPIVVKTIHRWLEFQDSAIFSRLSMLKELQVEMQQSAISEIKKSSGEIDYDQKYKNACYVKDLGKMIDDLEQELLQNDSKLKMAVKEIRSASKNKNTIGVETFAN